MATTAFGAVVYAGILWAAVRSQLRALGLGLSTKVARPPAGVAPLRCAERTRLAAALEARLTNPFIMVTGPTGVGKTTLIDSVLDGRPGVVSVAATRGAELNDIVDKALHAIASYEVNVFDGLPGAERVIKWHKRLFQAPPTVVLRVREQPPDAEPPAAASAARLLADTYGVQVIIDSDVALKTTPCCRVNVRRG